MSTPVEQLAFIPTIPSGGGVKVSLQDYCFNFGALNVKNFGATGNGLTDDTTSIQNCFDAAFGSYASPHGAGGAASNRPVFFPPGRYRVTQPLTLHWVAGGWVRGAGSEQTIIFYDGAMPGSSLPWQPYAAGYGANATCLLATDGCGLSKFQGFTLQMKGMTDGPSNPLSSTLAESCCFNWDWKKVALANEQGNTTMWFEDLHFRDATYGFLISPSDPGFGGSQGDTAVFYNCSSTNCWRGISSNHGNNVENIIVGGTFKGSHASGATIATPIYIGQGSIPSITGATFDDNDWAVYNNFVLPQVLVGLALAPGSTDANFILPAGSSTLLACRQESATSGLFMSSNVGMQYAIDGCYSKTGVINGQGTFYVRGGTKFDVAIASVFAAAGSATAGLREYKAESDSGSPAFTFAQLPALANVCEGLEINISDSPTATWGAPVTTGGSSNHVLLRYNNIGWTVVGK